MFLTRLFRPLTLLSLACSLLLPGCGTKTAPPSSVPAPDGSQPVAIPETTRAEMTPPDSINFSTKIPDGAIIGGFFEPDPGLSGRWIAKEGFVVLETPSQVGMKDGSCFIRLTGMNFRPDDHVITLKTGDEIVGELVNPQKGTSFTLWSKPLNLPAGEILKISIELSSTYRPADHGEADERSLGAMIEDIAILPASSRSLVNFSRPSEYLDVPISGMYAPEAGLPGRWTGKEMAVYLEKPDGGNDNYQIILHGINYRTDSFRLLLDRGGRKISEFQSPGSGDPFVFVSNLVIADDNPLVDFHVKIDPVYQPWKHGSNDQRSLGAFLQSIELRPATYPGCADFTKTDVDLIAIKGVFPEEEGLEGIGRWIGAEATLKLSLPSGKRVFNSLILEGTNYRIDDFLLSAEINGETVYAFHPPCGNFSIRTPLMKALDPSSIVKVTLKVRPVFNSDESGGKKRILGIVMRRVCIE